MSVTEVMLVTATGRLSPGGATMGIATVVVMATAVLVQYAFILVVNLSIFN